MIASEAVPEFCAKFVVTERQGSIMGEYEHFAHLKKFFKLIYVDLLVSQAATDVEDFSNAASEGKIL